jgi:hypothetical protein
VQANARVRGNASADLCDFADSYFEIPPPEIGETGRTNLLMMEHPNSNSRQRVRFAFNRAICLKLGRIGGRSGCSKCEIPLSLRFGWARVACRVSV